VPSLWDATVEKQNIQNTIALENASRKHSFLIIPSRREALAKDLQFAFGHGNKKACKENPACW